MFRSLSAFHRMTLALPILLLLAACGGGGGTADNRAPSVHITSSADGTTTASYVLSGVAVDNIGIASLEYTLNGAAAVSITASGDAFSANLTLQPGSNSVVVTARDAAGNAGNDSISVTYVAAPGSLSADRDIAAWGETVTVTGSDLGAEGTVVIGGMAVTPASWSNTQVTFAVPDGAPSGPQALTVGTAGGSQELELFVGVDYPAGTLMDLVELGLPRGTAVRLGSGEFVSDVPLLELDNLSLYGQGVGATTVRTQLTNQALVFRVSRGFDVVVQDLTLTLDNMAVWPGPSGELAELGLGSVRMEGLDVTELLEKVARAVNSAEDAGLSTQQDAQTSFAIRNVEVEQIAGGGSALVTLDLDAGTIFAGDLILDNVTLDTPGNSLGLVAAGDISITDSRIDSAQFIAFAAGANLGITDSTIDVRAANSAAVAVGERAINIRDSRLRVTDADLAVGTFYPGFTVLPSPGVAVITGSTLSASDATPANPETAGTVELNLVGDTWFERNMVVAQRDLRLLHGIGSMRFSGNQLTIGQAGIPSVVTTLRFVQSDLAEIDGNQWEFLSESGVEFSGLGNVEFSNNLLFGFDNKGTALSVWHSVEDTRFTVVASGNTFQSFENALFLSSTLSATAMFEVTINDNDFDFEISAAPQAATVTNVLEAMAVLDASNNIWGDNTDHAVVAGYVSYVGGTPGILEIDPVQMR